MSYIDKSYLSTQFTNFATRVANVFAHKDELPWSGTKAEYEAQKDNIKVGSTVIITDDNVPIQGTYHIYWKD